MKYLKIAFDIKTWHLKPYIKREDKRVFGNDITEVGFLFIKLITTWK